MPRPGLPHYDGRIYEHRKARPPRTGFFAHSGRLCSVAVDHFTIYQDGAPRGSERHSRDSETGGQGTAGRGDDAYRHGRARMGPLRRGRPAHSPELAREIRRHRAEPLRDTRKTRYGWGPTHLPSCVSSAVPRRASTCRKWRTRCVRPHTTRCP